MPESNRLTVKQIDAARRKAIRERRCVILLDGAGLRLKIGPTGKGRWLLRITAKKREKSNEVGLGPEEVVSLKMARDLAD